jgi:hypothetical protein
MQIVSFLRKTCYQYDISTIFIQNTKCHNILIKAAFESSFAWRLASTKSYYSGRRIKIMVGRRETITVRGQSYFSRLPKY